MGIFSIIVLNPKIGMKIFSGGKQRFTVFVDNNFEQKMNLYLQSTDVLRKLLYQKNEAVTYPCKNDKLPKTELTTQDFFK